MLYARLLARQEVGRILYLAVLERVRRFVFEEEAGQVLLEDGVLRLFSFDPDHEEIVLAFRSPEMRELTEFAVA